jgi:hypothetical protein
MDKKIGQYNGREGHAVAQSVKALLYKPKVAGSIPDCVIGTFH